MLDSKKNKTTPNKGKYLFHNRFFTTADWLLLKLKRPSTAELNIIPKNILVCCHAHIGDTILATSVLPVLKTAFPDADIGFLINPGSAEVLAENPHITWVHTFNHWKLNRNKLSLRQKLAVHIQSRTKVIKEIKTIKYDLAIDLYAYFPSSVTVLYQTKIPTRLGWSSAGMSSLLTHAMDWLPEFGHVVNWHKELLSKLSRCQPYLSLANPELYSSETVRQEWMAIATTYQVPKDYIVFHIGAGGVHRRWPTNHWEQLADLCSKEAKTIVLLGHGYEEESICQQIAKNRENICDLSGKLSWRIMAYAIGNSQLLVGLESASGHIAAAQKTPSISIYSGTTQSETWRPFYSAAKTITYPVICSPCYLSTGCEKMECLTLITAQQVFKEIKNNI